MAKRIAAIESTIERYLKELDRADREQEITGIPVPAAKVARLTQGIETLKAKLGRLRRSRRRWSHSGETQISLTDPDARAMTSQSHSAYTVGYNVQSAVDTEHHLIVAHEVTNVGIDKGHLGSMAEQAREALDAETIEAFADRGYFKSEEIVACEEAGIDVYVPRAADVERSSGGPIRSPRLRLRHQERHLCLPGRRTPHVSDDDRGGGQSVAPLLDERVRNMRSQGALHAEQSNAASLAGSTRTCSSVFRSGSISDPMR